MLTSQKAVSLYGRDMVGGVSDLYDYVEAVVGRFYAFR